MTSSSHNSDNVLTSGASNMSENHLGFQVANSKLTVLILATGVNVIRIDQNHSVIESAGNLLNVMIFQIGNYRWNIEVLSGPVAGLTVGSVPAGEKLSLLIDETRVI
jgi:hypothetical protein